MIEATPAWREAYVRIADELVHRYTTFWGAIDWNTLIGPDPGVDRYPPEMLTLIPEKLRGHSDEVGFVTFSPDGSSLASAGWDGVLKIWDARPLSQEVRVEREALGLLEYLFAKPLAKQEVIARLRNDGTISDAVRRQALVLVQRYH